LAFNHLNQRWPRIKAFPNECGPRKVQEKWSPSTLKCPVAIPLASPFNLATFAAALHLLLSGETFRPNLSGTFNAMSAAQQEDNAQLGGPRGSNEAWSGYVPFRTGPELKV